MLKILLLGIRFLCLVIGLRLVAFWLVSFKYANNESAVILAIPAGGVPVGYTAARALGVMADVVVVRRFRFRGALRLVWCRNGVAVLL